MPRPIYAFAETPRASYSIPGIALVVQQHRNHYSEILASSLPTLVTRLFSCDQEENSLMIPEDRVLLLRHLDLRAAKLRDEHLVAGLDAHDDALAVAVDPAGSDGEDFCLVELLDGGLRQEDAAGRLCLGAHALDEHAVEERGEGFDGLDGERLGG